MPLGLTLILLLVVIVVGLIATQWLTSLVLGLVRLVLLLIGFWLIARVGFYLLRKGGPRD